MRWIAGLLLGLLIGCSSVHGQSALPSAPAQESVSNVQTTRLVYVSDIGTDTVSVYPLNRPNAGPIKILSFPQAPTSVAVDSDGDLFVAQTNKVEELSTKNYRVKNTITNGISLVHAMAFDKDDNLYVSNFKDGLGYVSEYKAATWQKNNQVDAPQTFQVYGIAVADDGTIIANISRGEGAFLVKLAPINPPKIDGLAGPGGVTIGKAGQIYAADSGSVSVYSRDYKVISRQVFKGVGTGGFLDADSDGDVAIPFGSSPSFVEIEPGRATTASYQITGFSFARGTAIGP